MPDLPKSPDPAAAPAWYAEWVKRYAAAWCLTTPFVVAALEWWPETFAPAGATSAEMAAAALHVRSLDPPPAYQDKHLPAVWKALHVVRLEMRRAREHRWDARQGEATCPECGGGGIVSNMPDPRPEFYTEAGALRADLSPSGEPFYRLDFAACCGCAAGDAVARRHPTRMRLSDYERRYPRWRETRKAVEAAMKPRPFAGADPERDARQEVARLARTFARPRRPDARH